MRYALVGLVLVGVAILIAAIWASQRDGGTVVVIQPIPAAPTKPAAPVETPVAMSGRFVAAALEALPGDPAPAPELEAEKVAA